MRKSLWLAIYQCSHSNLYGFARLNWKSLWLCGGHCVPYLCLSVDLYAQSFQFFPRIWKTQRQFDVYGVGSVESVSPIRCRFYFISYLPQNRRGPPPIFYSMSNLGLKMIMKDVFIHTRLFRGSSHVTIFQFQNSKRVSVFWRVLAYLLRSTSRIYNSMQFPILVSRYAYVFWCKCQCSNSSLASTF